MKSRYKVILLVVVVDVEIFTRSQRPAVLKYRTYDFMPSHFVSYFRVSTLTITLLPFGYVLLT